LKKLAQANKFLIVFFVILLITIAQFETDIYLPSFPFMKNYFQTTHAMIQFSVTISMIGFSCGLFFYGPISDTQGRKKVIYIGLFIFLIGTIICFSSNHISSLLIGRFIQGIGVGCVGAVGPAIVRDCFSGYRMIKAFSVVSMALAATPIFAPIIGGYLQEYYGWKANFSFLFVYALLILIVLIKFLPETSTPTKKKFRLKSALKDYQLVISNKFFLGAVFCMTLTFAGEMSYLLASPFLLQEKLGLSPVSYGWLALLTIGGFFIGSTSSSYFSKFYSSEKIILSGILSLILGSLCMATLAFSNVFSIISIVLPMIIYMIGAGLIYPNSLSLSVGRFPKKAGVASAVVSGAQMGGAGLLTIIEEQFPIHNQKPLSIIITIFSFVSLLVFLFLIKKYSHQSENNA
jgi:Bcr/CflA subfamily drug resistance transporter